MTAPKKFKEKSKQRLTVRQQKLVEALTMTKSIVETATMAGYSDRTAASPALNGISGRVPEVLEGVGAMY